MPAGRPKQPIERTRALARGDGRTVGGRKIPEPATVVYVGSDVIPVMPLDLADRGRAEWHKIWDSGTWLHPNQDYAWVEQVARSYDDIDLFRKRVKHDGLIQKGSMGQVISHPLLADIRKCEDTIRKCLSVLGFSPTDRARLGLAEVKKQQGLADLRNRTRDNR